MTGDTTSMVPANEPEPLTNRLARLGAMMQEDEHKVLIAEAVEALHAAEAVPTESWTDSYQRRVLKFVGASDDVDLSKASIAPCYDAPYRYSEYESGGGYFALNVFWKDIAPREGNTHAHADWDGLYRRHAELRDEDVARFLDSLGQERPVTTLTGE